MAKKRRKDGAGQMQFDFESTEEQREAVEAFNSGQHLKIMAFAGSGKTTTLKLISESTNRQGIYLAFNKSIADEAKKKFPSNVHCLTTHSLAYRTTLTSFRKCAGKMNEELNVNKVVKILDLVEEEVGTIAISQIFQGWLVLKTLERFQHSADPDLSVDHVPNVSRCGKLALMDQLARERFRRKAFEAAVTLWGRMRDPEDSPPLGYDGFLKLWALTAPILPGDFVLLDEAQDSNPVILDVLEKLDCQRIYVGDPYQQIYEWRGAVNAMEQIHTLRTTYLTQSFRFGAVISTTHKAKGREWDKVRLTEDFLLMKDKEKPSAPDSIDPSELRLFYVALTRAKHAVDLPRAAAEAVGISLPLAGGRREAAGRGLKPRVATMEASPF